MDAAAVIVITGEQGAGKTTLVEKLADLARQAGWDVAGVVTPGRYHNGQKAAISVRDLRRGDQRELAELRTAGRGDGPETQDWRFHQVALDWGSAVLQRAAPCDLLVVDELGPLELERGAGWRAALDVLRGRAYRRALVVVRPSLLDRFFAVCPGLDVHAVTLNPANRDAMVAELAVYLGVKG